MAASEEREQDEQGAQSSGVRLHLAHKLCRCDEIGGRSAEGTPTLPNLAQQEIMEHDSRITQLRNGWIVDQ